MIGLDLTNLVDELGKIQGFIGEKAVAIAARVFRNEIIRKTAAGVDYNSIPFRQYKPRYKTIRDRKGLRTDIVNLRVTGDMLDSIYLNGDELTVAYSELQKAQGNEERWGREFLNVDERTIELACEEIDRELQMEIDGWQ